MSTVISWFASWCVYLKTAGFPQPSTAQQFKHNFNYLLSWENVTSIVLWIQALIEHPALYSVLIVSKIGYTRYSVCE